VIAWVYVGARPQKDGVDLSQVAVRKSLVKEALWLVNDCGFDGVQWDYEFAANNDAGLLTLLDDTRAALKPDHLISVDTPMWYPSTLWGWNDDYFRAVSGKCDQICVMSYDSYLYLPRAYASLLSQQVIHVSNDVAAANKKSAGRCKVLFGLPTYEDVTLAHNHYCESFANSLRGLKDGLNDARTDRATIDGIALFADYTTDSDEWKTYRDYWLQCPKATNAD
jgi:spore germination protein YaaH